LKVELQQQFSTSWTPELSRKLGDTLGSLDLWISDIILKIHETIKFQEAPLYFPEISLLYPELKFMDRSIDGHIANDAMPSIRKGSGRIF